MIKWPMMVSFFRHSGFALLSSFDIRASSFLLKVEISVG